MNEKLHHNNDKLHENSDKSHQKNDKLHKKTRDQTMIKTRGVHITICVKILNKG